MKKLFFVAFVLTILSCSEDPIVHTLFTSSNPINGGSVTPSKAEYDNGESGYTYEVVDLEDEEEVDEELPSNKND